MLHREKCTTYLALSERVLSSSVSDPLSLVISNSLRNRGRMLNTNVDTIFNGTFNNPLLLSEEECFPLRSKNTEDLQSKNFMESTAKIRLTNLSRSPGFTLLAG